MWNRLRAGAAAPALAVLPCRLATHSPVVLRAPQYRTAAQLLVIKDGGGAVWRSQRRWCFFTHDEGEENWRVDEDASATLEIEILPSAEVREGGAGTPREPEFSTEEVVVQTLEPFARAAVTNYISRVTGHAFAKKTASVPSSSSSPSMQQQQHRPPSSPGVGGGGGEANRFDVVVREVEGDSGGGTGTGTGTGIRHHARQRLPLPEAYGERFAEGFGATEKEADTLAAMHAVRILDALGLPVYQLSSKQKRHAEAARAAGRQAPLPGEPPQPPSTPTPPPLRYRAEGAVAAMERRLHVDRLPFASVTSGGFTPFQLTLASPYFLDHGSVRRVKQFFAAYHADIQRYSKVIPLHKEGERTKGGVRAGAQSAEPALFLAQLRLPILPRFGDRVCMGKAPTKKDAIALACMHAELTIDALGLALYPTDRASQLTHVEECSKVGRYCAAPGALDYKYEMPSPPPLQLVGGGRDASRHSPHNTAEVQRGAVTVESVLLQHSRAVKELYQVVDVPRLEECARPLFQQYLAYCAGRRNAVASSSQASPSPFFVEVLGIKFHETYRATVTVPLLYPHPVARDEESFVAIGISSESGDDAELAAATHALRALSAMNHPVAFDEEAASLLDGFAASSVAGPGGLPPFDPGRPRVVPGHMANTTGPRAALMLPVRCVSASHLGRILSPGLAGNKEHKEYQRQQGLRKSTLHGTVAPALGPVPSFPSSVKQPVKLQEGEWLKAIVENQRKLPRADWCLEEDAEHRIIVAPTASAAVGRNYVHTLSAVRTPDVFAVNRLKDYLERHGKRLDGCLEHVVSELAEGNGLADDDLAAASGSATSATGTPACAAEQEGSDGDVTANNNRRISRALAASAAGAGPECHSPPLRLHSVKCVLPTRVRSVAAVDLGSIKSGGGASGAASSSSARVVAHGEAYTMEEAVLMCAMHAELLLDALGIVLYDHPELQRRHADTARMLGRWAPLAAGALPPALGGVAVPPPLRKEHARSCLWARLEVNQHRRQRPRQTANAPPAAGKGPAVAAAHRPPPPPPPHPTIATTSPSTVPTDDELCDVARLQPIHHSEIFRMAARHVQVYYRSRGSDFYRSVRQYTTPSAQYGNVHRAIAELPLPSAFGRRFAVGCASSKKRALSLCATHAAWTLEALGIPIYTGKRQHEYATMSDLRGRSAPRPGDPMKPPSTPSPRGLCCFIGGAVDRPEAPTEPTHEELQADHRVWPVYVRACHTFIDKAREADLQEALFELDQAPRSGIDVEDDALDVVERAPLNRRAKHALAPLCLRVGVPAPALPFRYEVHGRGPKKRFLTETSVLGTPYTARGLGKTPAETLARTAMHYEYLLAHVAARNGGELTTVSSAAAATGPAFPSSFSSTAAVAAAGEERRTALFDSTWGHYTVAGQEAIIALYCATQPPFHPLVLRRKLTINPPPPGRSAVTAPTGEAAVFVARVDEASGSFAQVNSQPCEHANGAAEDAVKKLFSLLQSRPPFQAVAHFARKHPHLRLGAIATMHRGEPPDDTEPSSPLARLRGATGHSDVRAAAAAPPPPPPPPPPHEVLQSLGPILTARKDAATTDAETAGSLRSHMSDLLLEMALKQTGGGGGVPALTIPAAARDELPLMGLLRKSPAAGSVSASCAMRPVAEDGQESWLVSPVGVAVAALLSALPAPSPSPRLSLLPGPLLPLQLGKLLLHGLMLGTSVRDVCRVAALVLCGAVWTPRNDTQRWWWGSEDLVDRVVARAADADEADNVRQCEEVVVARLEELGRQAQETAPLSPLATLLRRARTVDAGIAADRSRRLRLAIAFATFPRLWTAHPTFTSAMATPQKNKEHQQQQQQLAMLFESQDGLRTALALPHQQGAESPVSSSPCYAVFDCAVVVSQDEGSGTRGGVGGGGRAKPTTTTTWRQHYGHQRILGTRLNPCASLVSTVPGCNAAAVLSVDEDNTDRIAVLYDGTVPLPLRSVEEVRALQSLQHALAPLVEAVQPLDAGDPLVQTLLALTEARMSPVVYHHMLAPPVVSLLSAYLDKLPPGWQPTTS